MPVDEIVPGYRLIPGKVCHFILNEAMCAQIIDRRCVHLIFQLIVRRQNTHASKRGIFLDGERIQRDVRDRQRRRLLQIRKPHVEGLPRQPVDQIDRQVLDAMCAGPCDRRFDLCGIV